MRALVLGGNGFIGSHVVDALIESGHRVRVFDRLPERYRPPIPEVDYRLGSFDDMFLLSEALVDMDVVFHLISTTVPGTSNLDPGGDIQTNLINTVRLLQQMVEKGPKRIVYLSSGGTVYGRPTADPVPETHPLRPLCSYGVVKVAIENYLYMFQELYGIKPVVLRASNPYGERQGHVGVQGVVGTFLHKMKVGEPIEIWGDGSVVRDFIYVRDLADLIVTAGISRETGVFNAGSGRGVSINELIDIMASATGYSNNVIYKPGRSFDISRIVLDISKTVDVFAWNPQQDIREGISITWKWLRQAAAHVK